MRKKIIGIILLVLIVFGGYKLFANVSANNVNSNSIQFSYEDIPAYNGDNPYVVVNDNKPYFTSSEIVKDSYIKYGPLDSIKRVTSAMACLDYDSMPSEDDKKGESKSICPTGWNNIKYDSIAGDGYCQNRVQSIAWCFGGSDTDKKNYITATPYMKNYMNAYVVKIARYLEKTSNHVMYRTTPVFVGEELMCRGVLMEAYSVEDNGEGICFNIFLYNVQPGIADKDKLVWIVDHNIPSDSPKTAASQKKMRDFAKANDIKFYEGEGVCHQVMMENHVVPGELIFGADSHTCAYGALGAFGTGVGCTDYLYAMVTGTSWVMVPGTLRFNLKGKLSDGVYARDLILSIIGKIGANGANYKAMEFAGEGLHSLSMADRISICNLCVEAGAKTALMEVDDVAMDYLKEHGREPKACFTSDDDAVFEQVYDIDLSTIQPIVAKPHFVDNVVPAKESLGVKIDEAFLGSCNNGRIEDLRVGAAIIKGKKVAPKVRFLVVPASRSVYLQAMKEGLLDIFMDAGAIVMNPNCSVCWGSCQGVIGEGETLISTGTRNFKGRAGHKDSFVYLASAATVTASAIKGEIATADMV